MPRFQMKRNSIITLALIACLSFSSTFTAFAAEENPTPENGYGFTINPHEAEGGLIIDSNGIKYAYRDGELIGRSARVAVTDTEDGKHVEHDSYYVTNPDKYDEVAAEAWTTVTKNGKNVYHKTGAKIGYNHTYNKPVEDFGYGKTTATTGYVLNYINVTMTSYWSTEVTPPSR